LDLVFTSWFSYSAATDTVTQFTALDPVTQLRTETRSWVISSFSNVKKEGVWSRGRKFRFNIVAKHPAVSLRFNAPSGEQAKTSWLKALDADKDIVTDEDVGAEDDGGAVAGGDGGVAAGAGSVNDVGEGPDPHVRRLHRTDTQLDDDISEATTAMAFVELAGAGGDFGEEDSHTESKEEQDSRTESKERNKAARDDHESKPAKTKVDPLKGIIKGNCTRLQDTALEILGGILPNLQFRFSPNLHVKQKKRLTDDQKSLEDCAR
jgi:hypothetical protein